jgi:hypothetical protein
VPLTKLRSHALRLLAAGRTRDSYVAGGVALNRAADGDSRVLSTAGLKLSWTKLQVGRRQAEVEGPGETMQLEWVADSDFRFFPARPDDLFVYVLAPVDLATNEASAAGDRRGPPRGGYLRRCGSLSRTVP